MRMIIVAFIALFFLNSLEAGKLVSPQERQLQRTLYTLLSLATRTQMMMKDYTLTVQGVSYANPEANLEDEIEEQNDEFDMLDLASIDPSLKEAEKRLRNRWKTISSLLSKEKKSPQEAATLLEKVDAFDSDSMKLASLLAKRSIHPALTYAFDLQRLDQLAQRISSLYEIRILQVLDKEQAHKHIATMLSEMEKITADLHQAPSSLFSEKLKKELSKTKHIYGLYKMMALSQSGHYIPALISQKSNEMDMLLRNIVEEHQVIVQHFPDALPSSLSKR